MVETLGLALGLGAAVVFAVFHVLRGTSGADVPDISQEVVERRAATVPETDFPEPMNRSIGGGGAAGAVAAGGAEGELEEGEAEETGFDPASIPDDEVEDVAVEFSKQGETVEVATNENLLEAGEDEGWDLPYACREGQCLSCAGRITDGDATEYMQMENNEVLSDDEIEKGYCLTCVAYPTGEDFTLETDEAP